jgi:protein O-mannosyl-transferase
MLTNEDCKIVWFLGAGTSASSGIPPAAGLVHQWIPQLYELEVGPSEPMPNGWPATRFANYSDSNPAAVYAQLMGELFPTPRQRQEEIERATSGREPGIGYALLASLAADEVLGPRANVFVTTNFDDLIAEAMYLTTKKKPLVVGHDNLSGFIRRSNHRPLVVKLHGDALLAPLNTAEETATIDERLAEKVSPLFSDCALIVLGYGGNDESIAQLLSSVPPDGFPLGIYWLSRRAPIGPVWSALAGRRDVFAVTSPDFDDLLLQLRDSLEIDLADGSRWTELFEGYAASLSRSASQAKSEGSTDRSDRADRTKRAVEAVLLSRQASELRESDPAEARNRYERAI